ncbi:MAG: hypothetical protein WKG32_13870 [Gemmatimonadaceae bacterium]
MPDPVQPNGPGIEVTIPTASVRTGARGARGAGMDEALDEAAYHVRALRDHDRIADDSQLLPPGATHVLERGPDGTQRLVRKRFSAI